MPPPLSTETYARYRRALANAPLPAALVDLDALDHNIDHVVALARQSGKPVRLANKSVRSVELLRYITARAGGTVAGVMSYTARETEFLVAQGFTDVLLAYPTARADDADALARANARGAVASVVVDSDDQLAVLATAARAAGATIPVVVEVDMAYRPRHTGLHLGVRRSPLHTAADVAALAQRAAARPGLSFHGVMGYEAQIAGVTDASPFARWLNGPKHAMKQLSRPEVERLRREVSDALRAAGLNPTVFNGGGTGSLEWCRHEPVLTEVTVGSGFLGGLLFDYYRGARWAPALLFALQVVRRPGPGYVTCHGGGFIASGEAGPDRQPLPVLPPGLALLPMEGAGEVQTPLRVPPGVDLALGDPVFFRHAKAGELAEHFNTYALVRGDAVERHVATYRGEGQCFL